MRTFIAVDLEPPLEEALVGLIGALKRTGADIRWVHPAGMHLTLKFIGETGPEGVRAVKSIIGKVASRHRRFPLILEGAGSFPRGRSPRVLWVGIRSEPALLQIQEDIERELEAAGFPREARAFHPHLTLGRVKGQAFVREALAELEKRGGSIIGEMEARNITFFESRLGPGGARYIAISEHPLS